MYYKKLKNVFLSLIIVTFTFSNAYSTEECFERTSRAIFKFNMALDDIVLVLENYDNIKYIAISNVEAEEDLTKYLKVIPKNITIVPKIESHVGIQNIGSKDISFFR